MDVESLSGLGPQRRAALFERDWRRSDVREQVSEICETVRAEGDAALRSYSEQFDDVHVSNIDITTEASRAVETIDTDLRDAIERAAGNIRNFHERQRPESWIDDIDGRQVGRVYRPIEQIGAYVPGGTAAYPSSALMTVIPARVAGVDHVVVTTPPGEPPNPVTLAAIDIAGADAVYQVGGAQAIAALAYGTETVPAVDKIVGPGNPWVTAAKAHVRESVEIDMLAGPSEILILADETANPAYVAADLCAQAEHGPDSPCVLVTDDESLAIDVQSAIADRVERSDRADAITTALSNDASGLFHTRSMSEAISFANAYASEHVSIQAAEPRSILDRLDHAGSVFLGSNSPVAAGDYATGPNHVLPTSGAARVTGGLATESFLRGVTVQHLSTDALDRLGGTIEQLATAEGLTQHAESIRVRTSDRSE